MVDILHKLRERGGKIGLVGRVLLVIVAELNGYEALAVGLVCGDIGEDGGPVALCAVRFQRGAALAEIQTRCRRL